MPISSVIWNRIVGTSGITTRDRMMIAPKPDWADFRRLARVPTLVCLRKKYSYSFKCQTLRTRFSESLGIETSRRMSRERELF